MTHFFTINNDNAIIICSNPYSVAAVFKKNTAACKPIYRREPVKNRTIIADYSSITANPYVTIRCTKNIVCVRSGKSICSIVYFAGITGLCNLSRNCITATNFMTFLCSQFYITGQSKNDKEREFQRFL